ncbi:hypothetical protein NDU88_004302 [Pleurodeles waltl]|uniref:Uncharacterized protein n=1 Tax=Pleurodeles waltl TaxID=8319 RepID=A0AAV7T8E1_PLEWA|nr:hypothetical protein NDU88_004302 [Pleurodeles waltl]
MPAACVLAKLSAAVRPVKRLPERNNSVKVRYSTLWARAIAYRTSLSTESAKRKLAELRPIRQLDGHLSAVLAD